MDEPLKSLEQLGAEFERVARRGRRRRRLPLRTSLLALIAGTSVTAGALAASGVLDGELVKDPPGPTPTANAGAGLPRPASAQLTALRVADPGGGPPWGLRTLRTTRELGCVQVGRVVGGRLGVLGQDGAFENDGRFHVKGPEVQSQRDCQALDGAGNLFAAVSFQGLPASGLAGGCTVQRQQGRPAGAPPVTDPLPRCPPEDLRILYYGTLGPKAESVTYRSASGRTRTVRTSGPDGAYLIVERPFKQRPAKGDFVRTTSPVSGLASITYRDGRSCRLRDPRAIGGGRPCPRVGYVRPEQRPMSTDQVRAPVQATVSAAPVTPPSAPGSAFKVPEQREIRVVFTAPIAAGPRSQYLVALTIDRPTRCGNSSGSSGRINRNVRAGERVEYTTYVPADCSSRITGEVRYRQPSSDTERDPLGTGLGVLTVGRFRVEVSSG